MAEDVSNTIAALEDERYTAMLSGDAAKPIVSSMTGSAMSIPAAMSTTRQAG